MDSIYAKVFAAFNTSVYDEDHDLVLSFFSRPDVHSLDLHAQRIPNHPADTKVY